MGENKYYCGIVSQDQHTQIMQNVSVRAANVTRIMLFTKAHGTQIWGEFERMIRYRTVFNRCREIYTEEVEAYGTSATAFQDDQTYANILKEVLSEAATGDRNTADPTSSMYMINEFIKTELEQKGYDLFEERSTRAELKATRDGEGRPWRTHKHRPHTHITGKREKEQREQRVGKLRQEKRDKREHNHGPKSPHKIRGSEKWMRGKIMNATLLETVEMQEQDVMEDVAQKICKVLQDDRRPLPEEKVENIATEIKRVRRWKKIDPLTQDQWSPRVANVLRTIQGGLGAGGTYREA